MSVPVYCMRTHTSTPAVRAITHVRTRSQADYEHRVQGGGAYVCWLVKPELDQQGHLRPLVLQACDGRVYEECFLVMVRAIEVGVNCTSKVPKLCCSS